MTRVRSEDLVKPGPTWYIQEDLACSSGGYVNNPSYGVQPGQRLGSTRYMSDVVIPHFHQRSRAGEVFFNPLISIKTRAVSTGGSGPEYRNNGLTNCGAGKPQEYAFYRHLGDSFPVALWGGEGNNPRLLTPYIISEQEVDDLETEVSTAVHASRGRADNNLFETVAEYRSTVGTVSTGVRSIQGIFSGAKNAAKTGADLWLQYRYGVMPVIRDIEAVISGLRKTTERKRITSRATRSLSKFSSFLTPDRDYFTGIYFDLRTNHSETLTSTAVSLDEFNATLFSNIGFTGKGLATLPWDLIPYSFVADWFFTLGDFLKSQVPAFGYKQLGSCLVSKRTTSVTYSPENSRSSTPTTKVMLKGWSGQCIFDEETVYRGVLPPAGVVTRSDFRFDTATRAADAAALLGQRILRG